MTGTARSSAREVLKIYKTRVIPMPTNRPPRRTVLPDRVFRNTDEKFLRHRRRSQRNQCRRSPRADRNTLDRQVGIAIVDAQPKRGWSIRCSTRTKSNAKPRSWRWPANTARSRLRRTWQDAEQTSSSAKASPKRVVCMSFVPNFTIRPVSIGSLSAAVAARGTPARSASISHSTMIFC